MGRGVKRDTEAPMPSSRRGIRPPDPKVKEEETQRSFIGTPGREPPEHEDGAESVIDSEHEAARSQSSALDHEIKDDETVNDVLKQVAAAMEGINKSIELMSKRVELIEGQKRKADDPDTLQSINNKDVDKPAKFDGKQWNVWKTDFLSFLERRDRRWPAILKAIDKRSIDPLTKDVKDLIGYELGLHRGTLMQDFTTQLYEYLKNYTSGEIQSRTISGGRDSSWETWRFLCDQGRSRRKLEVHEEYKKLMNPQPASLENLTAAILQWERDLLAYTVANDDKGLDEDTKKLCLENMCPEPLQDHLLEKYEQGMISTYDQYKQAVSTYVYRKTRKPKVTRKLNLLEADEDAVDPEAEVTCSPCGSSECDWDPQIAALKKQADAITGKLNALVRNKFDKGTKGLGKGRGASAGGATPMQVDHSQKDCYACGEVGHIAANCPKAGKGKGYGGKGGGSTKGEIKGKCKGKNGKGPGSSPGKGTWQPSLHSWRNMYPGPSPTQWTDWWRQANTSSGNYKGKTNLFEQGQRLAQMQQQNWDGDQWQWQEWPQPSSDQVLKSLFSGGGMYKLAQKGPKPRECDPRPKPVETKNKFSSLETDEENSCDVATETTMEVPLKLLIKPESRNRQRKARRAEKASEDPNGLLEFTRQSHEDVIDKHGLRVLCEKRQPEKLAPITQRERPRAPNGWEVLSAIVDSGATITAVHPEDGKEYKVEESAASRAGVTYDTAGSEDLPNLVEKKMAVLTTEGTLRGFHSQVAEVSSPLESVRQLLGSKHCVLFGLGENEDEHLIINKLTGEVNRLRDDGVNYLHDMLVVPPDEIANVQHAINSGASPFGRQGSAQ